MKADAAPDPDGIQSVNLKLCKNAIALTSFGQNRLMLEQSWLSKRTTLSARCKTESHSIEVEAASLLQERKELNHESHPTILSGPWFARLPSAVDRKPCMSADVPPSLFHCSPTHRHRFLRLSPDICRGSLPPRGIFHVSTGVLGLLLCERFEFDFSFFGLFLATLQ